MELLLSLAGLLIAVGSVAISVWANNRSAELASEQEQLRRIVRSDALFALIAASERIGDLELYSWMAAEEKRIDRQYVIAFLSVHVDNMNRIHGSTAYYLLKRMLNGFQSAHGPLDDATYLEIVGPDDAENEWSKRVRVSLPRDVGDVLLSLERNHYAGSVDVLYRMQQYNPLATFVFPGDDPDSAPQSEVVTTARETLGLESMAVLSILMAFFKQASILAALLTWYSGELAEELDSFLEREKL